ncbi:MAG: hypothetical protein Q9169_000716 [Polycauliona sp. 2 TL-2023]
MSDFQEAKSVRRSELRSRSTSLSSASSEEVKEQWRQKLDLAYRDAISEQSSFATCGPGVAPSENPGDLEEESYEFQLFSQKSTQSGVSISQPPRIVLRSPSPETQEPSFVRPERSQDSYFTGTVTLHDQRQFQEAAIEGERVLQESQRAWPGCHLRWRLTTLTVTSEKQRNMKPDLPDTTQAGKRKRPGKKRRIAVRIKTQARNHREEAVRLAEAEKTAFLVEKRSRRNREKKLKRREKARNQKEGDAAVGTTDSDSHFQGQQKALCPKHPTRRDPSNPYTSFLSVCDDDGPGNGINVCCDLGRKPGECCKNGSEIMDRGAPISSVIAGPPRSTAASLVQDDDPSLPTSTSSNTLTLTLRRTVSSSPSSTNPSFSSPTTEPLTILPATDKSASHSKLGAGLGGGLGGAAALLIGAAIFMYWRRRGNYAKESETPYHEMDAHDSTYRHNSRLFPAELTESKKSMEPAELPAKLPPGPYELQGDTTTAAISHDRAPSLSTNDAKIRTHEKSELFGDTLHPNDPGSDGRTPASDSNGVKNVGVK